MRRPVQPHVVLEQELQALLQEEMDGIEDLNGTGDGGGDDDTKNAIKKRVRVIKNRLAAKRSREQARTYVQQLESTLNALAAQNEFLARRLATVEAENNALKRGFAYGQETKNQTEFRGEPAVLPTSSLQLDGLLLISMLFSFCNHHHLPITARGQPNFSLLKRSRQLSAALQQMSCGKATRKGAACHGLPLSVHQFYRLKTRPKPFKFPLEYRLP